MWWQIYFGGMPLPGGLSKSKLAKLQNNFEFQNWFQWLYSITWDRFGYREMDPTLSVRNVERSFINNGRAGIARPRDDIRMANGKTIPAGTPISPAFAAGYDLNMYGDPLRGWGYGMDGFNHQFDLYVPGADDGIVLSNTASGYPAGAPEAVIGYNNQARYPSLPYIWQTAQRLADIWRASDVAVSNLKSPLLIRATEDQRKTVDAMVKARDANVLSVVYFPNSLTAEDFQVFPFNMDHEILREFRAQADVVLARFLEKIGYNSNANSDKRERLLVDEVNANNDIVIASLLDAYHERKVWLDRCNDLWGTNYEVYIKGQDPGLGDPDILFEVEAKDDETIDNGRVAGGAPGGGSVPGQRPGADDAGGDQ